MARFITFEGGDGAGKSTLLGAVERDLKARGLRVVRTREPGGTPMAEEIREVLLRSRSAARDSQAHGVPDEQAGAPIGALTELLLYEAARADHVSRLIRPSLRSGNHVLCDRFTHSSLAYQGAARGLGRDLVAQLNTIATGGLEPDLVVWLRLDPDVARSRLRNRGGSDRIDAEGERFHRLVFEAFERISREDPDRFLGLDASQPPDRLFEALASHPTWGSLWRNA